MFLLPCGGSIICSAGGLYTESTTTLGSSTVMNSTLFSSQTEMLYNLQTISNKREYPCLLCGCSATSTMPGMTGLARPLSLWVSWRPRQWQCLRRVLTVYGRHGGLWFYMVEELVIYIYIFIRTYFLQSSTQKMQLYTNRIYKKIIIL